MVISRREEDGKPSFEISFSILGVICAVWAVGYAANTLIDIVERIKDLGD